LNTNHLIMSLKEQVVLDHTGKAIAVQIPINQYKKLLEKIEDLEDIKIYDIAMKRKQEFIPFDEAVKVLKSH